MAGNAHISVKRIASRVERLVQANSLQNAQLSRRAPITLYWEIGNSIAKSSIVKNDTRSLEYLLSSISKLIRVKCGERFDKENLEAMVHLASTFTDKQRVSTLAYRLTWSQLKILSALPDKTEAQTLASLCYRSRLNTSQLQQIIPKPDTKPRPQWEAIMPTPLSTERTSGKSNTLPKASKKPSKRVAKKALKPDKSKHSKSRNTESGKSSGTIFKVWYATNRKPKSNGIGFTNKRSGHTTLGRVLVNIPKAHRFGEIGTPFLKRLRKLRWRDDTLQVQDISDMERSEFFEELKEAAILASKGVCEPHALCFIHGFNVAFDEAAIRAAQIGFDLKVTGPTAFFSWPSHGGVGSYSADEASIEASAGPITDFLADFAKKCGAKKVHLMAHSMGNRGLLSALQRIALNAEDRAGVKFGQIFLAAPDVDRDVFIDLAQNCSALCERTTLYSSGRDLAVWLSKTKHKADRAGYHPPYTIIDGIDTVCVPNFNLDLLGHSYYAQAEALLYDMFALMRQGLAPAFRQRIAEASDGSSKFWQFTR